MKRTSDPAEPIFTTDLAFVAPLTFPIIPPTFADAAASSVLAFEEVTIIFASDIISWAILTVEILLSELFIDAVDFPRIDPILRTALSVAAFTLIGVDVNSFGLSLVFIFKSSLLLPERSNWELASPNISPIFASPEILSSSPAYFAESNLFLSGLPNLSDAVELLYVFAISKSTALTFWRVNAPPLIRPITPPALMFVTVLSIYNPPINWELCASNFNVVLT